MSIHYLASASVSSTAHFSAVGMIKLIVKFIISACVCIVNTKKERIRNRYLGLP